MLKDRRRWICLMMVIVMSLAMVSCGSGNRGESEPEPEPEQAPAENITSDEDFPEVPQLSGGSTDTSDLSTEPLDPYAGLEEQPMPENEHKFVNKFGDNRPSKIVVENPTDKAFYMKFEDANGETVFAWFVRPQSTCPMYMGLGTYYLKWASGTTWYGEKDLFGPDTVYKKDDEEWPFEKGKYWTLTLESVTDGNVQTETIPAEEF